MNRQRAERIVNEVYNRISGIVGYLKLHEIELDNNRKTILSKLEKILQITGNRYGAVVNHYNPLYNEWMRHLNDSGYSEFVDMLVTMMYKIQFGGIRLKELPGIATLRNMYDPHTWSSVVIGPAGPVPPLPEPVLRFVSVITDTDYSDILEFYQDLSNTARSSYQALWEGEIGTTTKNGANYEYGINKTLCNNFYII